MIQCLHLQVIRAHMRHVVALSACIALSTARHDGMYISSVPAVRSCMPSAEKAADRTEPLILRLPTHVRVFRVSRGIKPCMKGGGQGGRGRQGRG